ncbi:hypothetical protein [Streptomyces sp. 7-21]|jgi:hypothetical protein|uniref:hypothetical protein n=1 Tax=Streptomyces sp. 7-21 TaxID=2802283 RepID=UPI00191E612B|nr:hypothetical protein [Streptomyces sp. 7-21]MBL1068913.1 hypothetical protein [Streptomyces sp. 7-21]
MTPSHSSSRRAAKIAISLPPEQLDYLKAAERAGHGSVSGHIQQLIQREREAADVEATLRRLFGADRPGPAHEAWARRVLRLDGSGAGDDDASGTASDTAA